MYFNGSIHIAQRKTSRETITDANTSAQCEWALNSLTLSALNDVNAAYPQYLLCGHKKGFENGKINLIPPETLQKHCAHPQVK